MRDKQLLQVKYAIKMAMMSCINERLTPYLIQDITDEIMLKIIDLFDNTTKINEEK